MRNPFAIKILISLLSFFLFLGLLEVGLRVVGYFALRSRNRLSLYSFEKELEERQWLQLDIKSREEEATKPPWVQGAGRVAHSILCLGDSYTYGGAVSFEDTYPSQLQKVLDSSKIPKMFKVYNGGICEYNSRQILRRLPKFIKTYQPDTIILLDGASNRYNFALYDMHGNNFFGFLRSLRVYKMAKIITFNLKERSFKWKIKNLEKHFHESIGVEHGEDGYLLRKPSSDWLDAHVGSVYLPAHVKTPYDEIRLKYNQRDIPNALELCAAILKKDPEAADILSIMAYIYFKSGQVEKAKDLQDRAFQINPDSPLVLAYRSYIYDSLVLRAVSDQKKTQVIEYCMKAIESDPFFGYPNYWALVNAYQRQSRFNSEDILNFFEGLVKKHPALMESKLFVNYFNYFRKSKDWEDQIEAWLLEDLEKIVKICNKNKINLIIQNYPYDYSMANEALETTARKFSVSFVDHNSVFGKLVSRDNYSEYFFDDEHCTPKGHQVMVKNVFEVLQAKFGAGK